MRRLSLSVAICLTLGACTPRGAIDFVPLPDRSGATLQSVFVASNRNPAPQGNDQIVQQIFGAERHPVLRYGRVDVSIPPGHSVGQIEWPGKKKPDPALHFVARDGGAYDTDRAFLRDLRARETKDRQVLLFVHGFNVNNAEAVYRLAQVAHDFDEDIPVIAYSWASAGSPQGYVYDRDSVIFSRDGLEKVVRDLAGDGWNIAVVGHSMGSQLVMETLRQMSIGGRGSDLARVNGVVLISPDIDEDVFVQQSRRIRPFPQPFMLMVSARDKALGISAWLTGKPTRLGSIRDRRDLQGLPVQVVDLSKFEGGDRAGHATAFTAPEAIAMLRGMQELSAPR